MGSSVKHTEVEREQQQYERNEASPQQDHRIRVGHFVGEFLRRLKMRESSRPEPDA
jgi:hypothetical protein